MHSDTKCISCFFILHKSPKTIPGGVLKLRTQTHRVIIIICKLLYTQIMDNHILLITYLVLILISHSLYGSDENP